jgi:hypothetical protein
VHIALVLIPLVIAIVTIAFGVIHTLLRTWLNYRLKLAFLESLEKQPDMLEAINDPESVVSRLGEDGVTRQNYALTGALLAVIGVICIAGGRAMRVGQLAVGTFLGGFVCLFLGVCLTLLGLVIRALAKNPAASLKTK